MLRSIASEKKPNSEVKKAKKPNKIFDAKGLEKKAKFAKFGDEKVKLATLLLCV